MAYQTGSSTGPNDLLDKLKTFLEAEGWTTNSYTAIGAGYRLHVQKTPSSGESTMYFNFRSAIAETGSTLIAPDNDGGAGGTVTGLCINGSTGYDGGQLWHSQPGVCTNPDDLNYAFGGVMSPMSISAIPAYYFFTVEDTVNVVVECTSGEFQFMSFGMLEKQGLFTGGMFFSASYGTRYPTTDYNSGSYSPKYFTVSVGNGLSGAVYVDVDSDASWRVANSGSTPELAYPCVSPQTVNQNYTQGGMASFFWSKAPNFYNNIAAMCPIYTFILRSDTNYSLIGWPAGVRFLNVTNYSAGQELVYGSETWKIFPVTGLGGTALNLNTGFAFLKVV